jgi:putative transposase
MAYSYSTGNFEKMLLQFMSEEDPMLSMLKWLCEQLMEAEVTSKVNASKSERNSERSGYRSGYRVRRFDTRMGTLYLFVPKLRKGGYIPFFVTEKKRSEVALMNVIQEAYVNGVSTRKIEKLAKSLGIDSISRSQVSQITRELNDQVEAFRKRPLKKTYPVLWVDALYEKIRYDRHVKNMAVLVVVGLYESGRRDILAIEPMQDESEATYKELFQRLKDREVKSNFVCKIASGKTVSMHLSGNRFYRLILALFSKTSTSSCQSIVVLRSTPHGVPSVPLLSALLPIQDLEISL